jgi:hypothetical protein
MVGKEGLTSQFTLNVSHDTYLGILRLLQPKRQSYFQTSIEKVAVFKLFMCRKLLPYCPPYALQENTHFPL